jgi:hypothetical protein
MVDGSGPATRASALPGRLRVPLLAGWAWNAGAPFDESALAAEKRNKQAAGLSVASSSTENKGKGRANSRDIARSRAAPRARTSRASKLSRFPITWRDRCGTAVAHCRRVERAPIRIASTVRASTSEDGLVLLDLRSGEVLASNRVGAQIWALIAERCTRAEIVRRIAVAYDVPTDRADRDVATFVTMLAERGLVTEEAC